MIRTLILSLPVLLLAACASTPKMTEAERDAAMKKCFDTFKNYPQQRDRCLNHARTAEIIAEDEN